MDKYKHLGIRIDKSIHQKISYISQYEGRSINGQVLHIIKDCIRDFENINGEITVLDKKSGSEYEQY